MTSFVLHKTVVFPFEGRMFESHFELSKSYIKKKPKMKRKKRETNIKLVLKILLVFFRLKSPMKVEDQVLKRLIKYT
jgi:hypothetical protein